MDERKQGQWNMAFADGILGGQKESLRCRPSLLPFPLKP
jgi:hypothetical protein